MTLFGISAPPYYKDMDFIKFNEYTDGVIKFNGHGFFLIE